MSGAPELEKIATKKKKAVRKIKAQKKLQWFSEFKKIGKLCGFSGYGQESKEILHNAVEAFVLETMGSIQDMKDKPSATINFRRALCGTTAHTIKKLDYDAAIASLAEQKPVYEEFKVKFDKMYPKNKK
jgi:hypothetical protein